MARPPEKTAGLKRPFEITSKPKEEEKTLVKGGFEVEKDLFEKAVRRPQPLLYGMGFPREEA